ncbi:MAG TPA: TRAFs-binding domain-containing protein [Pyrinomonadaceae bacterium]|nr:TRAFs-binding domain-containing protein [Pyrinomonadaceae bacterium]
MSEKLNDLRGTCFVVMGFGKKTDFESGRTLDLDKSYRNIIKPAVEAAKLKCVRADEIVHSGLIDIPMYEQLLQADVVVADLSTSNKNAFYELGVRHALKPFTTIVIAEDGIKAFPFDVNHVIVRQYHHLGEDIGFDEVMRFRKELTDAIDIILKNTPPHDDSPVYSLLKLKPPCLQDADTSTPSSSTGEPKIRLHKSPPDEVEAAMARATLGVSSDPGLSTHHVLMEQVDVAQTSKNFLAAKTLLQTARELKRKADPNGVEDPSVIQRLALVTYKSQQPSPKEALHEAKGYLELLNPETSNDTETLGLWGAIHKRLWDLGQDESDLDEAVRAYERGFYLRNDYYNGINFAYLLNVRAAHATNRADAIADFVQAQRVRKEVLSICQELLKTSETDESKALPPADRYWVMATIAEAHLGLGHEEESQTRLQAAFTLAFAGKETNPFGGSNQERSKQTRTELALHPEIPDWMKDSTQEQIDKLRQLIANSPLKYINEN